MTVSVEIIKKMNPCKSRFEENFLVHYPAFDSDLETFLQLDKITYNDKIWVARRLLNKNQLIHFAILSAQSVLEIYQNKYPNDNRIKDVIDYMITIVDFSNLSTEQTGRLIELRKNTAAAYAADAADAAAYAAAAVAAAAYAADAAAYAAAADAAAAYAVAAYAADAAAAYAAAYDVDVDADAQKNLNLQFLLAVSEL